MVAVFAPLPEPDTSPQFGLPTVATHVGYGRIQLTIPTGAQVGPTLIRISNQTGGCAILDHVRIVGL